MFVIIWSFLWQNFCYYLLRKHNANYSSIYVNTISEWMSISISGLQDSSQAVLLEGSQVCKNIVYKDVISCWLTVGILKPFYFCASYFILFICINISKLFQTCVFLIFGLHILFYICLMIMAFIIKWGTDVWELTLCNSRRCTVGRSEAFSTFFSSYITERMSSFLSSEL